MYLWLLVRMWYRSSDQNCIYAVDVPERPFERASMTMQFIFSFPWFIYEMNKTIKALKTEYFSQFMCKNKWEIKVCVVMRLLNFNKDLCFFLWGLVYSTFWYAGLLHLKLLFVNVFMYCFSHQMVVSSRLFIWHIHYISSEIIPVITELH